MTFVEWDHVAAGPSLRAAFLRVRDEERRAVGCIPGQTGSIAEHEDVVLVHDEDGQGPVTEERARHLAEHEYGYRDTALAIRLRTEPGKPKAWFIFGKSHM